MKQKHVIGFTKLGTFHFCLQSDDFQGVIDRVKQCGEKVRMDIMRYHPKMTINL